MKLSFVAVGVSMLLFLGAGCAQQPPSANPSSATSAAVNAPSSGVKIDLSGKGLHEVPKDIFQRTDVTSLDLSDNDLGGALPAEIGHMRSLQILDVSGNHMTGVPAEVGQLHDLRVLDLSNNRLTGLPYELGNLQKLELLDVSGNNYSTQDLAHITAQLPKTTVIKQ